MRSDDLSSCGKIICRVRLFVGFIWSALFVAGSSLAADPSCLATDPDWIFCEDFESGSFAAWDDYDGNPEPTNTIVADLGPFGQPGNLVARLRAPVGRGGADLVKVLPETADKMYARWYVQWEPGYDFNARNHGSGLFAGDRSLMGRSGIRPDGTDRVTATLEPHSVHHELNFYAYYPGMYQDCVDPNGSCWGDSFPCLDDSGEVFCTNLNHRPPPTPPVLETGRWYCIEMLLDMGSPTPTGESADGVLNFWVDGIEYGPWTGLWMRSTPDLKVTILLLRLWHHDDHSTEGILIDDVVVSTSPIGPGPVATEKANWGSSKAQYR